MQTKFGSNPGALTNALFALTIAGFVGFSSHPAAAALGTSDRAPNDQGAQISPMDGVKVAANVNKRSHVKRRKAKHLRHKRAKRNFGKHKFRYHHSRRNLGREWCLNCGP